MARSRNIKPGFFRNEDLVELPYETRLLFIGLWTVADREGRLEDRPKRIKMELFPADDLNIDTCLDQLADRGFIVRYGSGDARYIQVSAFNKHQNPHQKEQASTIPAPDEINSIDEESDASTGHAPDMPHASRADSLNTDSLNTDSLSQEGEREYDEDIFLRDVSKGISRAEEIEARFDRFWAHYPRKEAKGAARKAWMKRKPSEALTERIIAAVDRQKNTPKWKEEQGRFIPHPATWLNSERWEDEGTQVEVVRRFVV